jgi:alkane 1-monooxygenase
MQAGNEITTELKPGHNLGPISESAPTSGKYRHIAFCFLPQVPCLLFALGAYYRGYSLLLPAFFLLFVVPLLDALTGWQDDAEFRKSDFSPIATFLLRWNTRLYAIFYLSAVVFIAKSLPSFTVPEIGFAVLSLSVLGGICFAAAHEMLHEKGTIDQWLQRITTAFLFYPHYKVIHIQSHHTHAATDHDKNTAWLGESIYSYLLRTVPESMMRCWQVEVARLARRKVSGVSWILQNQMFAFALTQLALLAALYLFCGLPGVLFYVAQIVGAHLVLESVNYIQHYGLMRDRHDGSYEKTGPEHSWDTYHYFSSYVSFRVGHHSFHHLSMKPYYLLSAEPAAPKLPVGYFWAIPMVLVPPWWHRVIDPRLVPAPA